MKEDTFSTYNPIINFLFFIGAIGFGMCFTHPAYLACSVFFSALYLYTIKGPQSLKFICSMGVMFLILTFVNGLFNPMGETVLFTYFGRNFTLEATLYGMATSAMVVSIFLWFSSYNSIMSNDKFMFIFGKIIPSGSLIISMALRLVTIYKNKIIQIYTARRCIGKGIHDEKDKRSAIENGATVVSTLATWALEGGVITADSMKMRGYGLKGRTTFSRYRFDMRDKLLVVIMLVLSAAIIYCAFMGSAEISYIPKVVMTDGGIYFYISIISYALFLSIAPIINITEAIRWHILRSGI